MTSIPRFVLNGRMSLGALCAVALLTACSADDAMAPAGAVAAKVVLTVNSATSLGSLGDSAILTPRVLDASGRVIAAAKLVWSVSKTGIVQADGEGVYRAIANGRVTIVAAVDPGETGVRPKGYWADPIADSVTVDVRQRPVRLAVAPVDTAFVTIGATRALQVQATDARGNPMPSAIMSLAWVSADPRVVTVDSAGLVRSRGEGAARVTVRADSLVGTATFAVNPRLPHTSCMVYAQRKRAKQSCVTLDLVLYERGEGR